MENADIDVEIMDNVTFWSRQFAEHGLFVGKALDREDLTKLGMLDLKVEGFALYDIWMDIFNTNLAAGQNVYSAADLAEPMRRLQDFLVTVRDTASQIWVGFAYPEEAQHYIEELEYLQIILDNNGIISQDYLLRFWSDIHMDHASLIAHLLDPSELDDVQHSMLYADVFRDYRKSSIPITKTVQVAIDLSQDVADFNEYTMSLRERQAMAQLKSIIHPRLALHIYREGLRSLMELTTLVGASRD